MMGDRDDTPGQFGTPFGVLALAFVVVAVGPIFLGCVAAGWLAVRVKAVGRRLKGRR